MAVHGSRSPASSSLLNRSSIVSNKESLSHSSSATVEYVPIDDADVTKIRIYEQHRRGEKTETEVRELLGDDVARRENVSAGHNIHS